MALLSIKKREEYFELIGIGAYNKRNILRLQKKYFRRDIDYDGIYGKDTDTLLRHIVNVMLNTKNFKPEEFRCSCGMCTGYPDRMKAKTLKLCQHIRSNYNKPMTITSGLRCLYENSNSTGSVINSKHLTGQAFDYYIYGVTDTVFNRKKTIKVIEKFKYHDFSYGDGIDSDGNIRSAKYMGNAMHTQSK